MIEEATISEQLLGRRLPVVGHIKIGGLKPKTTSSKGTEFQPPTKFDFFRLTKRTRGPDGNYELDTELHAKLGDKPTELDVRLPFDTRAENFYATMAHYQGRTTQTHKCDGKTCINPQTMATRPCDRLAGKDCPCKPYARLSLILEAAPYGGVYVYRTTSWESVPGLQTFLGDMEKEFPLSALPLRFVLYPAEITYGKPNERKIGTAYRVALQLRASWEETRAAAVAFRRQNQIARRELLQLSAGVRTELDAMDVEEGPLLAQEFFPEEEAPAGAPESKLGQINAELVEELIGELRGLMARADAVRVHLNAAQKKSLEAAITSRDTAKLTQSIEWLTKRIPAEDPNSLMET